ncbi:MAG: dihydroorotate dehydrogenase electron transfer subunit [Clostridiales Family XIII bacterium]|jgi:dihydroorotate dehydrogenase electron transfer subunit|nr:dihydroorotate dehydrogenase electron transfer subunit [Clostridiales Family XIII bacterium]
MSETSARDILRPELGDFFAEIVRNEEVAAYVYRMILLINDKAGTPYPAPLPGQFVNVYLNDAGRLLPRPISACDWSNERLTLVFGAVGAGTRQMAAYAEGTRLRVGAPEGCGFDTGAARGMNRAILVGGGLGAAPLLLLADALRGYGSCAVRAVLGFGSEPFLLREFEERCDEVFVATDDGSAGFHGNAADLLKELSVSGGDSLFACGPAPMLRVLSRFAGGQGIPLQVSLEERMGCGYGACLGCACTVAGAEETALRRRVCRDGPVFNGSEVIWDV